MKIRNFKFAFKIFFLINIFVDMQSADFHYGIFTHMYDKTPFSFISLPHFLPHSRLTLFCIVLTNVKISMISKFARKLN